MKGIKFLDLKLKKYTNKTNKQVSITPSKKLLNKFYEGKIPEKIEVRFIRKW